ncbi:MAG: DUF3343 domain-containing protein [Clostridia bacterium]|nr:DUF3343 domain-containing protein [Clostridia bacterium]
MESRTYILLAFETTHAATAMQRRLSGRVGFAVMPTLRLISASCGISLRVETENAPELFSLLHACDIPYAAYLIDEALSMAQRL